MSRVNRFLGRAVVAALAGAMGANGQLLVYDDLDVSTGVLHGVETGDGWLQGWEVQNGAATVGYAVADANPLSFSDLVVTGNYAVGADSFQGAGRRLLLPQTWEPGYPAPLDAFQKGVTNQFMGVDQMVGAEGSSLWVSMLVRCDNGSAFAATFHTALQPWTLFQALPETQILLANDQWQLRTATESGTNAVSSGVTRELGTNYLMVLHFEFVDAASDTVTLYVDPAPGLTAPDVAGTAVNSTGDVYFRSLRFYPGNAAGDGAIDELRFGATYADVTPAGGGPPVDPGESFTEIWTTNTVGLAFGSASGDTYRLEFSEDLLTNVWETIPLLIEGTGGEMTVFDPAGHSSNRTYRILKQ